MNTDVGAAEDFAEGAIQVVEVDGIEIGVVRWGERFHAVRNICPHMEAPICQGVIAGQIRGDGVQLGMITVHNDQPVIVCPWHRWEFYAETGNSVVDGRMRLRVYETTVTDGRVMVAIKRRNAESPPPS